MKRTYTSTKKFKDLTKAIFKLYLFNKSKYGRDFDCDFKECTYTDVTSFEIISRCQEAEDIEKEMFPDYDEYGEYLILHFSDGSQATFRNSYVDMFILKQ
jgi:hypothetical protein